jgi:hypothetical protein
MAFVSSEPPVLAEQPDRTTAAVSATAPSPTRPFFFTIIGVASRYER